MITKKQTEVFRNKRWIKKNGLTTKDGSSATREMAGTTFSLLGRKFREIKADPYTSHPMSFEEYDNIPGIEDLQNQRKRRVK